MEAKNKEPKMGYTEEGIPVRTIYVPELTINVTHEMVRDHFRYFGAIERVVIHSERIQGNDLDEIANPVDFFNQQENVQRNYFAYVTYVAQHGAQTALRNRIQKIQNHETKISPAFAWNQAACDVQEYLTRVRTLDSFDEKLYGEMVKLNDDCFLHILKFMGVLEMLRVLRACPKFESAVINHKHIRIEQTYCSCGGRMSLMQLRELLKELHFGENISNLYISAQMFSQDTLAYVYERLCVYIGRQLRSLTMAHFDLRSENFVRLLPLLVNLEYFDADYSSSFDFQQFNNDWNQLLTLHIRTYGQMNQLFVASERLPAFPALSRLLIQGNFLKSQTFIDRLATVCPNLTEFIAFNISDMFIDMSRINPIDMTRLLDFRQLNRLVLSFTRRHFSNNFMDIICQMRSLQHLMIDITKSRDEQIVNEVNRNLVTLATNLPQLKELLLIGVAVDNANILSLIEIAVNLEKIAILDCSRFNFVPNFVRGIVDRRRELFRNAGLPTKPLTLLICPSIFENARTFLSATDLGAGLVVLQQATCYDLYKNYLKFDSIEYVRGLRNHFANAQAHQDMGGMGGRRIMFLRNDPMFMRNENMRMMGRGGRAQRNPFMFGARFEGFPEEERPNGYDRRRRLEMLEQFGQLEQDDDVDVEGLSSESSSDSSSDSD